jgi:hypothetical protein
MAIDTINILFQKNKRETIDFKGFFMKKLLLSLSFMALVFTNIKAEDDLTINETTALEQIVSTENNDRLMLEEQPLRNKSFLDLSIREVWNTKLKPFLTSTKGLALLLSSFSVIQICRLSDIAKKMLWNSDVFHRYKLFQSFDVNFALLAFPHACLIGGIIGYTIAEIIDNLS